MTIRWMIQNRFYRGWCIHSPFLYGTAYEEKKPQGRSAEIVKFHARRNLADKKDVMRPVTIIPAGDKDAL